MTPHVAGDLSVGDYGNNVWIVSLRSSNSSLLIETADGARLTSNGTTHVSSSSFVPQTGALNLGLSILPGSMQNRVS
jgi:hypothetical protein